MADAGQLSTSNYADRRKELLRLVNQLRGIGAQADLDLPRIVVIGNQSAGKSSVVEAISGINVPRDSGTCTRCPMECRLSSSSGSWSAQVFVRWEYDEKGDRNDEIVEDRFGEVILDKADVELQLRRAQAWVLNPKVEASHIMKMDVEKLRKISRNEESEPPKFSKNVVCIDIEGSDLTDLAFIDLPGIIANADPQIVKLIEELVVSHIQGNSIILVALPMTDDLENQKAMRLAREADREGKRTIGVLTKPDLLGAGSKARTAWLDVIEGNRQTLLHGYYCTRQPDDNDREKKISTSEARKAEEDFFNKNAPWSRSTHRQRFGTQNLIKTLSDQLEVVISNSLPVISKEATECLAACNAELSKLPKPLDMDPAMYMINLITTFSDDFSKFADGVTSSETLIQANRKTFRDFKMAIRKTVPNFVPYIRSQKEASQAKSFSNYLEDGTDEGPEEGLQNPDSPQYLEDLRQFIDNVKSRELPGNVPYAAKLALIKDFQRSWPELVARCINEAKDEIVRVLFDLVQTRFSRWSRLHVAVRGYISELVKQQLEKCFIFAQCHLENQSRPFTMNDHYLQTCRDKWLSKYKDARAGKVVQSPERPTKRQKIAEGSHSTANGVPQSNGSTSTFSFSLGGESQGQNRSGLFGTSNGSSPFGTSNGSGLFGKSNGSNLFGKSNPYNAVDFRPSNGQSSLGTPSGNEAPGTTVRALQREPSVTSGSIGGSKDDAINPSQSGDNELTSKAGTMSDRGSFGFDTRRPETYSQETVDAVLAGLQEIGYGRLSEEDLGKLNPPDIYETELEVMAEIRSYFQVSYKRIIDEIPMTIDNKLLTEVSKGLREFLMGKVSPVGGPDAAARCAKYLAEDPNVVARRDELTSRRARLETVKSELNNFGI